jgi:hypothetical protein
MPAEQATHALVNDQTDRLYLVSSDGIVQCLHERGAQEPVYYQPKMEPVPPAETTESQSPAATDSSFEVQPEDDEAEPMDQEPMEEAEAPAEETPFGVEENPFEFEQ